ncbi:MAG: hypothetical protein IPN33_22065 [Saprospiraceae bacterium]|nr:hypothetical protein [Saprospiraceae bacterium]
MALPRQTYLAATFTWTGTPLTGNYYAVVKDDCCLSINTATTWPIAIEFRRAGDLGSLFDLRQRPGHFDGRYGITAQ